MATPTRDFLPLARPPRSPRSSPPMNVSSTSTGSGKPFPSRAHQHRTEPVQHRPRGLVRADLERALQALGRDAVLLCREQPAGGEPHRERRARPVQDRACRHRRTRPARRAPEPPIAQPPATEPTAVRARKPARPTQPLQVIQAVSVDREPRPKLAQRPRVVRAANGNSDHPTEPTPCGPLKWIPPQRRNARTVRQRCRTHPSARPAGCDRAVRAVSTPDAATLHLL